MKISSFLLRFPLILFVLATVGLLLNIPMNPVWLFVSLIVSGFLLYRDDKHFFVRNILISIGIIVITVLFAVLQYDYSNDGQWYHCAIEYLFAHHWNPIYDGGIDDYIYKFSNTQLWINHYAKGYELIASGIVQLTGAIDSGKSINLMLIISAVLASYCCLKKFLNIENWKLIIIDLAINFNPVVINQIFTNCIDWILYVMLILTFCNLYHYKNHRDIGSLLNVLLIVYFIPSSKFNSAFWYFLISLVGLILFFPSLIKRKLIISSISIAIIGFLLGGFSPYITNTIRNGNPFYPLVGNSKVDIISNQFPIPIKDKSNLQAVNISLASNPYDFHSNRTKTNIFKISKDDIKEGVLTDTRLGGFGIFFFESTILLLFLFLFLDRNKTLSSIHIMVIISILFLYVCLFIFPCGWWARYVSFFYLAPILLLLYLLKSGIKCSRKLLWVPIGLLLIDSSICFLGAGAQSLKQRTQLDYLINVCKETNQPVKLYTCNYSFIYKLNQHNVKYNILPKPQKLCRVNVLGDDIYIEPNVLKNTPAKMNRFVGKYFPLELRKN